MVKVFEIVDMISEDISDLSVDEQKTVVKALLSSPDWEKTWCIHERVAVWNSMSTVWKNF